jgi:murein DD-endopeptidase MepM/ murein hydrolase activator NlpD
MGPDMTPDRHLPAARRRRVVAAVVAVVIGSVGVAGPLAAAAPEERSRAIHAELGVLGEEVDQATAEERAIAADLERTQLVRADLDERVADLEEQLAGARADLRSAEEAAGAARAAHRGAVRRAEETRAELRAASRDLRDQAVAAFIGQGQRVHEVELVLEADDVRELEGARALLGAVARSQAEVVTRYGAAARTHDALEAEREAERRAAEEQEAAVSTRTAQVATLHDEVARAREEAAAAVSREEDLLAAAVVRRGELEARLASLRAESDAIGVMLAARQAAEDEQARLAREAELRQLQAQLTAAGQASAGELGALTSAGVAGDEPADGGVLLLPLASARMTSGFGTRVHPIYKTERLHTGMDFGAPSGTPIRSAAGGVVIYSGPRGGYGNTVVVDHGGGLATLYAHQSVIAVTTGETVERGQVVGAVGSTGLSTGPHLHFEVRLGGTPVDPLLYL